MSNRLVVARYREDMRWLTRVPKHWRVSLVTKDIQVPNRGREASSFLYAMQKFCDNPGHIMFVQGNPFDHFPELIAQLQLLGTERALPDRFVWCGNYVAETDDKGGPHHWCEIPVGRWFEDLTGRRWDGNVGFVPGGQFLVPTELIRQFAKDELAALQRRVEEEEHGPWVMERLWGVWFNQWTLGS